MTESRLDFEREARELASKYEDRMRRTRTTLESQRKGDIQRIEDRKSAHIAQLMSSHDKGFAEIRAYYTDITHSNLDLIKSLKEEVAEMKKKEASDEKLMYEIAQENKRMSEPLKRALAEVKQLRAERESYRYETKCPLAGQSATYKVCTSVYGGSIMQYSAVDTAAVAPLCHVQSIHPAPLPPSDTVVHV